MNLVKSVHLTFTKRFKDDKEFLKQHDNVFKEMLEVGIIEEVTEEEEVGQVHYLHHHPVIRNDKATTKLRVVFDASAASKRPSSNFTLGMQVSWKLKTHQRQNWQKQTLQSRSIYKSLLT